jgi:hypothetical protein
MGETMTMKANAMRCVCTLSGLVLLAACATTEVRQGPPVGPIAVDEGGAVGYQHGFERSRFAIGTIRRHVKEFGLFKEVGADGTFAVDAANGSVTAILNAPPPERQQPVWYTLGFERHNAMVVEYFMASGLPRDQIGGVHAMTSLSASYHDTSSRASETVTGYQSVLQRRVHGIPVADSVAWARMNDHGAVLGEGVYWPAIPGRAITDARRLQERLSQDSTRNVFLARLPVNTSPGAVVIRHSSAVVREPFEAFASYDVIEPIYRREAATPPGAIGVRTASVVRHFDVNGTERRLPQESWNRGGDSPERKPPPPAVDVR